MPEVLGEKIEKVITGVKRAVKAAQQSSTEGQVVEVEKLELTLKGLMQKSVGGELNIRIPILDTALGTKAEITNQEFQTIKLTLVPIKKTTRSGFTPEKFERELVEAIKNIQEGIKNASSVEPRFELQDASIELNFVVNNKGEIALLMKGSAQSEATQTVKLSLRPKSA